LLHESFWERYHAFVYGTGFTAMILIFLLYLEGYQDAVNWDVGDSATTMVDKN